MTTQQKGGRITGSLAQRLIANLRERGVPDTPKPKGEPPIFPANIAVLSDDQLAYLSGVYTAWANYLEDMIGSADATRWEADNYEAEVDVVERLRAEGTVQERKDAAFIKGDKARRAAVAAKIRTTLLTRKLNQYDRALKALSREQTRRDVAKSRRL